MSDDSRYRLGQHEDGSWHVIDARTGGPVEIEVDGRFVLLWKLSLPQAQAWVRQLNEKTRKND